MKKNFFKKGVLAIFFLGTIFNAAAQGKKTYDPEAPLSSTSSVNWMEKKFTSTISFDLEKANIPMPSGKNSAITIINSHLPNLIKDPLLTLRVDSSHSFGDYILEHIVSLEDVMKIVGSGEKSLGYFDNESFLFKTKKNLNLNDISSLFVRHNEPYSRRKSIDTISSRAYTGIIIDARGRLPVHGEFVEERVNPCFFPKIWNEKMEVIYERGMMESALEKEIGECAYDWSGDINRYKDRIGSDPIHISAQKVYGRNRTDLIISDDDTLRIFSVPQNAELLKKGKIVILLDRDVLEHDVAAPIKDEPYYTVLRDLKLYPLKHPGADKIEDTGNVIRFTYKLNFVPDSPQLLPDELPRIAELADLLKRALSENAFTIFVGGHTADIGQHENQMRLSVERTQTVMRLLIGQGINEELFTYHGYGETVPIGNNETPEGRAENRRVEIELRPRTTYIQRSW